MRTGIRFRLALLLAAFGVVATGLTGLYSFSQSGELLLRAAERDLMSATQVFGRRLTSVVRGIGDDVRFFSELETTRALAQGDGPLAESHKSALADAFHAMLRANPPYLQIRYIGAGQHGLEVVRVDRDGQAAVRVIDEQLQEKAHFPYVLRALALPRGEVFLSKMGINHEVGSHAALNQPCLHVSSPVLSDAGQPLGVVVITVNVAHVFSELRADMPPYLRLFLTNEWGDFIVHPDASQAFGFEQGQRVLIQDSFSDVQPLLDGRATAVLARAARGSPPAQSLLGAFIRLPLARSDPHSAVVVGVAEPLSEILASSRSLGFAVLQIVAGFSAAAIVLAVFAARVVTRPLKQMTREVQRFSSEHPMGELPTRRQDEIGELARGFQEMHSRIGSTLAELEDSRRHLAHMARHDTLTGLPNRTVFLDRLEHAILQTKRQGGCLAVLFVDLDRFKHVNDTYGHAFGDRTLVQTARLLRSSVREVDTVARWGGDEFVILLESMDEEHEARRVAQTLLDGFARRMVVDQHAIDLGVSIGISLYPRDAFDGAELIQRADEAMYLAKHRAGNRYSVFGNESVE
jgi:diguanylate cyclase (GGDEF)-like protein